MVGTAVRRVFDVREFRAVWFAELLSIGGDQLTRVALAVLVFTRTGSAAVAAATYALTFLPALVGGVALSWIADRFRRREVMAGTDMLRALLTVVLAIPGLPLSVLCAVLVVVVLLGAPRTAAEGAVMPGILGDLYESGLVVRQMTVQAAQLVGFATGGLVVATLNPSTALLVDAATFAAAAVVVRIGLVDRPPPERVPRGRSDGARAVLAGVGTIVSDPRRRALVLLAVLVGLFVAPEALAAPYAAQVGAGPFVVGLLMAADPVGGVLGAWLFVRFVPLAIRERLVGVVAAAAGLPLVLMLTDPPVAVALVLWALTGLLATAYLLQTQASFVRATPDAVRGQAIGVAGSSILAGQGIAALLVGLAADAWSPTVAIALSGGVGVVAASLGALAWGRAARSVGSGELVRDAAGA